MIVIQFLQYLLHYSFPEQHRLSSYAELIAILPDCRHLTVVQIYDLSMATHQRLLLLLKIVRINRCRCLFLLCHENRFCLLSLNPLQS